MAFCTHCGSQLSDGSKYCFNCGASVQSDETQTNRNYIFDGQIHKCPNCGDTLNAMSSSCPSCGYELRGTKVSDSMNQFTQELAKAETEEKRIFLIRNFLIPNNKEDIFEFMMLASTNLNSEPQGTFADTWKIKIEECYQKASIILANDSDFRKLKQIYEQATTQLKTKRQRLSLHDVFVRNISVLVGVCLLIVAIIVHTSGHESVWFEVAGAILIIVSALSMMKRKATLAEHCICAASGVISLTLAAIPDRAAYFEMAGVFALIIVAISYFKNISKKVNKH